MKKKVKKLTLSDLANAKGGRAANDSGEWSSGQFEQGSNKIDLKPGKEASAVARPASEIIKKK